MLSEQFDDLLLKIGNPTLEHPVFYKSPIAIRFEIGCETPIYLDVPSTNDMIVNPKYIDASLQRVKAIYTALPQAPNLLRIDVCPKEDEPDYWRESDLNMLQNQLPPFHEKRTRHITDCDELYTISQLYWDLYKIDFSPDILLREIIKADLGGISDLASNVYFANTKEKYLYHLYDDRGADLAAERKETLRPIYHNFNQWILDYDRREIDELFAK